MSALQQGAAPRRMRLALLVPLVLFLGVAALFLVRLMNGGDFSPPH
jgi:hypothetical protein